MAKRRGKSSPEIEVPSDLKSRIPAQDWCEDNCLAGRFIHQGKRCLCISNKGIGQCVNPCAPGGDNAQK